MEHEARPPARFSSQLSRQPHNQKQKQPRRALRARRWSLDIFREEIPKGFRPKAQGCDVPRRSAAKAEARATLGNHRPTSQPQGGCVSRMSISAIRLGVYAEALGRNPVGVVRLFDRSPRGNWNKLLLGRSAWARPPAFAALRRGTSQPWALLRNPFGISSAKMSKLQSPPEGGGASSSTPTFSAPSISRSPPAPGCRVSGLFGTTVAKPLVQVTTPTGLRLDLKPIFHPHSTWCLGRSARSQPRWGCRVIRPLYPG